MGIDEYDAELHEQTLMEIGYEKGIDIGREQGVTKAIINTISILKRNGFPDDKIISELASDFDISVDKAAQYVLGEK